MSGSIGVINAGSSSIKFGLFAAADAGELLFRGQIDGIGVNPRLKVADGSGEVIETRDWPVAGFDHDAATREILEISTRLAAGTPARGIGHRIVHGGMSYVAPVRIDDAVMDALAQLIPLAPLHQPHNL